jgi:ABC-2 type transport system permease protein
MTAFTTHFAFEFKTGLRNSSQLLMNYLFPLAFYAMMGLVMTQVNPGFRELLIPSMIILVQMSSMLLGMPGPLVEFREAGVFRSFKINGVPAFSILVIPTLSTMIHSLIVSIIISLTAPAFFKGLAPSSWLAFALITLAGAFTFGAIGMLIGVIANSNRSLVFYSQMIFLPSFLLGGMMVPMSMLPASVRPIAGLLPTTHIMQVYTGYAFGQATTFNPLISTIIFITSGIIAFGLAIYLFNWDSRNNSRRGSPWMGLLVLVPYIIGMFIK